MQGSEPGKMLRSRCTKLNHGLSFVAMGMEASHHGGPNALGPRLYRGGPSAHALACDEVACRCRHCLSCELTYERALPGDHLPPWPAVGGLFPREGNEKSVRTEQAAAGLLVDFAAGGRPIGLEITAPGRVSTDTINRVLTNLGLSPLSDADLAPLRAA
jgi:hypothetical protein